MKLRYLKSLIPAAALTLTLSVTSCVSDLDVNPIDPSTTMEFHQNEVFTKIYATMGLTGQQGPAGSGDVDGIDEGTSDFYRLIWNANELPTDESHCCWGDVGIPELNYASWGASHSQVTGLYYRLYFDITLCNFFLEQTDGKTDSETVAQRAETRFMRALNYYYLIDLFGNVPFVTKVTTENPKQISRAELFDFIESELKACEPDMLAPKTNTYGRADKVAAWLLLSRLYLNAEVYTGKARWADAASYAQKVMTSSYTLCNTYKYLFMADNNGSTVNTATSEIILPIIQNGTTTQNYGGSLFLIASTHKSDMTYYGTTEGWAGNSCRPQMLAKFFPTTDAPNVNAEAMVAAAKDDRAMFYGVDRTLSIDDESQFVNGFSCAKFSNVRADGASSSDSKFVDMDVPFMRVAEAYLTFAEATMRANGGVSTQPVTDAINALRTRAHAKTETSYTYSTILDEWSREFALEGRRRSDLIRFGKFGGNSDYTWQWKGGTINGTNFSSNFNVFPIPTKDLNSNPNLVQNPGY